MVKWLEKVESALGGGPGGPKRIRTLRILLIIAGIGAIMMVLNSFLTLKEVVPPAEKTELFAQEEAVWNSRNAESDSGSFAAIETALELRLKDILEKIVGVGEVSVFVTVDSTAEIVVERNEKISEQVTDETDRSGGKRHMTSTTEDGQVVLYSVSGGQQPIVKTMISPRIRGVLVVARGAENTVVRRLLMEAVEKGVQVPVNKISVLPSKQ